MKEKPINIHNFKQASQSIKSINLIDQDYFEPQVKVYNSKMMLLLHLKVNND